MNSVRSILSCQSPIYLRFSAVEPAGFMHSDAAISEVSVAVKVGSTINCPLCVCFIVRRAPCYGRCLLGVCKEKEDKGTAIKLMVNVNPFYCLLHKILDNAIMNQSILDATKS